MKLQLVDGARAWYRMYSIWFFTVAGMLPEIWNLAIQMNVFSSDESPAALNRLIQLTAFVGAVMRLVQQKVVAQQAQQDAAIRIERESQLAADQKSDAN